MVVDSWGLEKGTEVHIEVTQDAMTITPVATIRGRQVREADLQRFWEAMSEVEVKTRIEDDGSSLRVKFSGGAPEVTRTLVQNLRRALPAVLSMLGVRVGDDRSE
jgi:hypothetical protein